MDGTNRTDVNGIMDVSEAADYLHINKLTLYRLVKRGKIPAIKVGSQWRFKKEVLDEMFGGNRRVAEDATKAAEIMARFEAHLHAEPDLDPETADALAGILKHAYRQMLRERFRLVGSK